MKTFRFTKKTAKIAGISVVMFFLLGAASSRNNSRGIKTLDIKILDDEHLLITHNMITHIISKNIGPLRHVVRGDIRLANLEHLLLSNAMIQDAQVSLSVDGKLNVVVKQREPIARVLTPGSGYYIDSKGLKMPLSKVFSSRVPIVTGIHDEKEIKAIFPLLLSLQNDVLLKKIIVGVNLGEGKCHLEMRSSNVDIILGDLEDYRHKLFNLKVFYQKATRDNILKLYSKINLEFTNQVVCTKR